MRRYYTTIIAILFCAVLIASPYSTHAATAQEVQDLIAKRNAQIAELEQLIANYENLAAEKRKTATSIQDQIKVLGDEIQRANLEIKSLSLNISKLDLNITKTKQDIGLTELRIDSARDSLKVSIAALARGDRETPVAELLKGEPVSAFFNELYDLYFLQSSVQRSLGTLKAARAELASMQNTLEDQRIEQEQLKRLQELSRKNAESKKGAQKNLLTKVKKEEEQVKQKITLTKKDIQNIREQITYLIKAGIGVEDAIKYGQLAATRLGIRPAFLLALLEVESRLGQNVGKGTWKVDMPARDHEAFLQITKELGLDPDTTPVSKKPSYGWGGAMGPAQFIPTTWLAYKAEVTRLTGHNPPSPWSIEDSFTAAAIKLSRSGAASKTPEGERAAAKAYISGNPNCTKAICNSYSRMILDKANQLEKDLNGNGT